jgi:hypothetical protein
VALGAGAWGAIKEAERGVVERAVQRAERQGGQAPVELNDFSIIWNW